MIFWIIAACLTAGVAAVLLAPLARAAGGPIEADGNDIAVYRDQLGELDRDVESGLIAGGEADIARAEIGRRLLTAARESAAPPLPMRGSLRKAASVLVVVLVPVLALGAYLSLGAPGLPSQPLSGREAGPGGDPELGKLIQKAEDHLRSNPDDGRGWDVLAPIYLRTGRLSDAEAAYVNAIRLLGATPERQSGLGETLTMANNGQVTEAARAAFREAQKLAPGDPRSAFFLAMALAQDGSTKEAIAAFKAMEAKGPPDAPWIPIVRQQIAALGGTPQIAENDAAAAQPSAAPPGNPSAADVAAAQNMSAGDRLTMIKGMVGRLDAQLREQPRNIEGWKRLVRSYMVLKDPAKAKDALSRALTIFPPDSADGQALLATADELGLAADKEAR